MSVRTSLSVCAGLLVLASAVAPAVAGDLDPPESARPGGVPAPTMKSLDDIPGSWHRRLSSDDGDIVGSVGCNSSRFKCVMGNGAVLDRETGLVWDRSPSEYVVATARDAAVFCVIAVIAGRMGWRLPRIEELLSLRDNSSPTAPYLPSGHPFTGVSTTYDYYSATAANGVANFFYSDGSRATWLASFRDRDRPFHDYIFGGPVNGILWCVRGGSGPDTQ